MTWEYEGEFLNQFPKDYRGAIGHMFCQRIREGARTPQEVIRNLRMLFQDGHTHWGRLSPAALALIRSNALRTAMAEEFAAFLIERESLPHEERQKLKRDFQIRNGADFARQAMAEQPPTEKQLKYLKALGCKETPRSKLEASDLITRYKNGDAQESRTEANSRAAGY